MEKDNKVLLGAVLILLVAMLSFNFNTLTGKVIKRDAVTVTAPSSVYFNQYEVGQGSSKPVTVTITLDEKGLYNKLTLYRKSSGKADTIAKPEDSICGSQSYCKKSMASTYNECNSNGVCTVNYLLSGNIQPGDYYFKVQRTAKSTRAEPTEEFKSNILTVTKWVQSQYGG